jgi:MFS family permease
MLCYAGFSLCSLGLLALTSRSIHAIWPIYAVLLGNGVVRSFNGPAGQSFLPSLVAEDHFPNAVAWSSSIFMSATIMGPAIGGLLYGFANSPAPVYASAALGALISLTLVSRIRLQLPVRVRTDRSVGVVLDGLRYIWRKKLVLGAMSLDLFAVLLGGAVALLPVYADQILKIGPSGLGLLRSGPGMGAMLVALITAYHPLKRHAGAAMLWCVAGFGTFTVVFGVSRNAALSMGALVLLGACDMVSVIVRHTMVQLATPDEMRGRVSAVNMVFIGASNEVGQFESGITAQWFGTAPAVVAGLPVAYEGPIGVGTADGCPLIASPPMGGSRASELPRELVEGPSAISPRSRQIRRTARKSHYSPRESHLKESAAEQVERRAKPNAEPRQELDAYRPPALRPKSS